MSGKINLAALKERAFECSPPATELLALVQAVEAGDRRSWMLNQCVWCGGSPYLPYDRHDAACPYRRFDFDTYDQARAAEA